jgi:hypothetical protein
MARTAFIACKRGNDRRTSSLCPTVEVLEDRTLPSAPTAVADIYRVAPKDGSLTEPALNSLLLNDLANGGGTLSVASHTNPAHGTLSLNADGSFSYTPNAGFVGDDTFTYTVKNAGGTSNPATVTMRVGNPYPQSTVIKGINWDYKSLQQLGLGSDLWASTYDSNGNLYGGYGDGGGFGSTLSDFDKVPTGIGQISGNALPSPTGVNVWGGVGYNNNDPSAPHPYDPVYTDINDKTVVIDTGIDGSGGSSPKPQGLLSVQDAAGNDVMVFAMNAPNVSGVPNAGQNILLYSLDHGAHWTQIANTVNFPLPGNLFGPGATNTPAALDGYLYGYFNIDAASNNMGLFRMPKSDFSKANIASLGSHLGDVRYFAGLSGTTPIWSKSVSSAAAVISDIRTESLSVIYDPNLQRYIATYSQNRPVNNDDTMIGSLTVLEAPNPWGSWSTVADYNNWGGSTLAGAIYQLGLTIPQKPGWLNNVTYSTAGSRQTFAAFFSGVHNYDAFDLLAASDQYFLLYPTTPTNLTASAGNRQVRLMWTASPDAATYNIYRSTSTGAETLLKSGVIAASFTDSGLTNGTTYFYKITAVNAAGESAKSAEVSVKASASTPATNIQVLSGPGVTTLSVGTTTAQVGAVKYTDRTYTIAALSSALVGGTLIQTGNSNKHSTANYLQFTLTAPATVYVVHDDSNIARIHSLKQPGWLSTWTKTSLTVDGFTVYSKTFAGGTVVTLGGNLGQDDPSQNSFSNYLVIVQPL